MKVVRESSSAWKPRRLRRPGVCACVLALPPTGTAPLDDNAASDPQTPTHVAAPFEPGGELRVTEEVTPDPRRVRLVRWDVMTGPVWRIRPVDTLVSTSLEIGQQHGFSGTFNTGFIISSDRLEVQALDVPIGVGFVARGKTRNRNFFGSIGASAGILVHRANTDRGVIHRVDPDFRVPIRFAWTAHRVGFSLALVPGYSVRNRTYERRGVQEYSRSAFRIGLTVGLHVDAAPRRLQPGRRGRQ